MKQFIPDHIIEEVRTRADLVEVVSDYVLIKKAGKDYKGLCPFHVEKTPSFTVSPEKRIYHCFGCGKGGNAFKFLMETQSISFVEAVRKLAARYSVAIPEPTRTKTEEKWQEERKTLFKLNTIAAEFFESCLHRSGGKEAKQYLHSRSFDDEIISKYQLGWSSPDWRDLLVYLEKRTRCSRSILEKAGLVKSKDPGKDGGNFYDRFRGRVIFPFKDIHGDIIGFAGRVLGESTKEAKYLNSPETLVYKKGNYLFGLNHAREAIRKENRVLVVEGYFDQIRGHQHGIMNIVATCGTALTPRQVSLLRNYTANVILVFDSDLAGQSATERGFDLFLDQGMNVSVIALPQGHDPDSFIQEQGKEAFLERIKQAKPFMEYFIDRALVNRNVDSHTDRMQVIQRVLPFLSRIKSSIERSEGVRYLSEQCGIEDKALLAELKKSVEGEKTFNPEVTQRSIDGVPPTERYLVHLIMADKRVAKLIRNQVSQDDFQNPVYREMAGLFYRAIDENRPTDINGLLDQTDDPQVKTELTKTGLSRLEFDNLDQAVIDCIQEIKKRNLQEKIKELKKQRIEAEKAGRFDQSRELHDRVREMQRNLNTPELIVTQ